MKDKNDKKESLPDEVNINIGLMEWREDESCFKVRRGKQIVLRVSPLDDALNIQIKATQKFQDFYPNLYDDANQYHLVYESGEIIVNLPGSSEKFILNRHKSELGKDYKQIVFYLCANEKQDEKECKKARLELDNQPENFEFFSELNLERLFNFNQSENKDHFTFCPICNQRIPITEIDEHANSCLDKQKSKLFVSSESETESQNLRKFNQWKQVYRQACVHKRKYLSNCAKQ